MAKAIPLTTLLRQVEAALKDGQPRTALHLARQFAAQKPGPATDALIRRCYLAWAESLVHHGSGRDAEAILTEAEQLPFDDPDWWEKLAELRADLGDHSRAVQLLEKTPHSTARVHVMGRVVDRAVREGPAGKALLPPELHSPFDLVRKAFAHYEAGEDDDARSTLNGIGLTSPFLDWKLLLRGLISWTANDRQRSIENWSRLVPTRLPARLAAPFRLSADRPYAATLSAERLAAVSRQADHLSGGMGEALRKLRKQLAEEDTLPDALETARAIVPELKRIAPDLVPRLANVVYWGLVAGGQPEDLPRYSRVFGPPADDPQFYRLQALVCEQIQRLDMAHAMWRRYEEWIARTPTRWPGRQADRARALVLERMGRLAHDWLADSDPGESDETLELLNYFRQMDPAARKRLSPSAAECFQRATELAPDWVTPAVHLLREQSHDPRRALATVQVLVERFPNDMVILEAAADLYQKLGDVSRAHDCLRRALAGNPLDRRLRKHAAGMSLNAARELAVRSEYDAARSALREASALGDASLNASVRALSAAIEKRAGNIETANRDLAALASTADGRLAAAYRMSVEGARLKLKKKDLGPHQASFMEGLAGPATCRELESLLEALDQYRQEPVPYRGFKAHEKKIVERLSVAAMSDPPEDDMVHLGLALHRFRMWKPLRELGDRGLTKFHDNPHFPFFVAEGILARQRTGYVNQNSGSLYCRVKVLIGADKDGRYRVLQDLLDERVRQSPELNHWLNGRTGR